MKCYKNRILILLFLFFIAGAKAQDTTALLKEFNKVMSFAVQPYVHYIAYTKMEAVPVMQPEDTLNMQGEFYKNETSLYYSNRQEEMFLEDSFFIQINHDRKSIWISRLDVDTKEKMNVIPLSNKKLHELFLKKYTISKTEVNENSNRLNFESKQHSDSLPEIMVNIALQYSRKKFMPEQWEMNVKMKQAITEEMAQQFKSQGAEQVVKSINGNNYFMRDQHVTVTFGSIDNSKEKAMQMPSWKQKLDYNTNSNEFSAKNMYSDYEITKTF